MFSLVHPWRRPARLLQQDAVGVGRRRPGAATWPIERNVLVVFVSGVFPPLYDVIHKTGSTYRNAGREGPRHRHR